LQIFCANRPVIPPAAPLVAKAQCADIRSFPEGGAVTLTALVPRPVDSTKLVRLHVYVYSSTGDSVKRAFLEKQRSPQSSASGWLLQSEQVIDATPSNLRAAKAGDGAVDEGDLTNYYTFSHTVSDLENGRPYAFKVTAANAICVSDQPKDFSNRVIPATRPQPPLIHSAQGGNRQLTIRASRPLDDGGSEILRYRFVVINSQDERVRVVDGAAWTLTCNLSSFSLLLLPHRSLLQNLLFPPPT